MYVSDEQKEQIELRNRELEYKRKRELEAARLKDEALKRGENLMPEAGAQGANLYADVTSRLLDQTESYIAKMKAARIEREEMEIRRAARGEGGGGMNLIGATTGREEAGVGNFAQQIGVQKTVRNIPQWRQQLYG